MVSRLFVGAWRFTMIDDVVYMGLLRSEWGKMFWDHQDRYVFLNA